MASARLKRQILVIVATDATFRRVGWRGGEVWRGKCLHCGRKHQIALDGTPLSRATVEHIVPQHHGGTDALSNLGLACARCNHGKGVRHDRRDLDDPKLAGLIRHLTEARTARWRDPPLDLQPLVQAWQERHG